MKKENDEKKSDNTGVIGYIVRRLQDNFKHAHNILLKVLRFQGTSN